MRLPTLFEFLLGRIHISASSSSLRQVFSLAVFSSMKVVAALMNSGNSSSFIFFSLLQGRNFHFHTGTIPADQVFKPELPE
jgi:hypothetical protein